MILLVGGLLVGVLMGEEGWHAVSPLFDGGFKGALTLFILEMGIVAAERLGDLRKVGPFLLGFGVGMPLVHGAFGATGYTVTDVRGEGSRGLRVGEIPGHNQKIEILTNPALAEQILDRLANQYFPSYAIVAWVCEVVVVRGEKYVAQ